MRSILWLPVAVLAVAPLACSGSSSQTPTTQYPVYGQQPAGYPQQTQPGYAQPTTGYPQQTQPGYAQPTTGYPQQTQPGAQPTTGYPTTTQPTQTTPATQQPASGGANATAIDPTMAGAATPLLTGLAASEVSGMKAEGKSFAGQFQEGQTLEQPITLNPGKCYSVVGVGLGVQQLDITLVAQPMPMLPAATLAQSSSTGSNATLGGKGSCYKNALPMAVQAKVVVKATRGAGMAVAQIYVK